MKLFRTDFQPDINAPSSKSEVIRMLICAALSDEPTEIVCTHCDDTDTCAECIRVFGAKCKKTARGYKVTPAAEKHCPRGFVPDFGECAAALRLIQPAAMILNEGRFSYTASERLKARVDGSLLSYETLSSKHLYVATDMTSQTLSGICIAMSLQGCKVDALSNLDKLPYVSMTLGILRKFRASFISRGNSIFFAPVYELTSPGTLTPEGDWSGAAYLLGAGALGTHKITVHGLCSDTLQGDRKIADILRDMGAGIEEGTNEITVFPSQLHAIDCDISETPDLFPPVAALCAAAEGESRIRADEKLRLKESDRIESVCNMINSAGGTAVYDPPYLYIKGGITGGQLPDTFDHRIFMSYILMSVCSPQAIEAQNPDCISKSYPGFTELFRSRQ